MPYKDSGLAEFFAPAKKQTRSVREILKETTVHSSHSEIRRILVQKVLPWINTEAVANKEQEKKIRSLGDEVKWTSLFELISLLNSLRG